MGHPFDILPQGQLLFFGRYVTVADVLDYSVKSSDKPASQRKTPRTVPLDWVVSDSCFQICVKMTRKTSSELGSLSTNKEQTNK